MFYFGAKYWYMVISNIGALNFAMNIKLLYKIVYFRRRKMAK